jgi:methylated-DNA-[protein]-cysteine S-methyltransferase
MKYLDRFPTPVAEVVLAVDARGALKHLDFVARRTRDEVAAAMTRGAEARWDPAPGAEARRQVEQYFAGERTRFELELAGDGTPFQRAVWRALGEIPFGATASYGELARRLGRPQASRAVGRANGTNPIALVVPCHRVIGANGSLTGYAGGLPIKRALLDFERGQRTFTPLARAAGSAPA